VHAKKHKGSGHSEKDRPAGGDVWAGNKRQERKQVRQKMRKKANPTEPYRTELTRGHKVGYGGLPITWSEVRQSIYRRKSRFREVFLQLRQTKDYLSQVQTEGRPAIDGNG